MRDFSSFPSAWSVYINVPYVCLQVLEHIKYVNFTTQYGAKVFFDKNGDSVVQYDLVNWQMKEDGSVEIINIGQYDTSFPDGSKLQLKENTKIVWGGNNNKVNFCFCFFS